MNTMDLNPKSIDQKRPDSVSRQDRRNWWATLFLLCGILGAMLGLSVRTQQAVRRTTEATGASISKTEVEGLQRTVKAQQDRITELVKAISSGDGQKHALAEGLKSANFVAGLTAVQGPGVVVTLNDSKNPYPGGLPPGLQPPNIIHDTDINQVINELKAAQAEAISVNDQRLVAVSPVRCAGPTIFVNNTAQTPPYVIKAIGDPKTLETALNISGGISTQIKAFDIKMFNIETAKHLVLPAYSGVIQPKYAVPVSTTMAGGSDKKPGA